MRAKKCNGPLSRLDQRKKYRAVILMPLSGKAEILFIDFGRDDVRLNGLTANLVRVSILNNQTPDPYLIIDAKPAEIRDEVISWNPAL
jgi:hypothetical protein